MIVLPVWCVCLCVVVVRNLSLFGPSNVSTPAIIHSVSSSLGVDDSYAATDSAVPRFGVIRFENLTFSQTGIHFSGLVNATSVTIESCSFISPADAQFQSPTVWFNARHDRARTATLPVTVNNCLFNLQLLGVNTLAPTDQTQTGSPFLTGPEYTVSACRFVNAGLVSTGPVDQPNLQLSIKLTVLDVSFITDAVGARLAQYSWVQVRWSAGDYSFLVLQRCEFIGRASSLVLQNRYQQFDIQYTSTAGNVKPSPIVLVSDSVFDG